VDTIRDLVQGLGGVGGLIDLRIGNKLFEVIQHQPVMRNTAFAMCVDLKRLIKDARAKGIPLFAKQVHQ
jgi:hypothetical protein